MIHLPTKKFNTYQIKPADTIESIALALGKKTDEVIRFHNVFAKQDELVGFELMENLEFLYTTPLLNLNQTSHISKVAFLYDTKLGVPVYKNSLTYQVNYTCITGDTVINTQFKMSVVFTEKVGDYSIYTLNKIPNPDQELPTVLDDFIEEIEKAIYPLELIVNEEGFWIGIQNFKAIHKRYQLVKLAVLDEYEGTEIIKRLSFYDTLFKEEERLTDLLQKEAFLQIYFNGLYKNHTRGGCFETNVYFPILPHTKKVDYKVSQKIFEYLTPENKITIQQTGQVSDSRSMIDFQYELDEPCFEGSKPTGNYTAQYVLDSTNNTIDQIAFSCSIKLQEVREIKMTITLTR